MYEGLNDGDKIIMDNFLKIRVGEPANEVKRGQIMFSKFFIHRPVFACVLSIIIVIAGLVSYEGVAS